MKINTNDGNLLKIPSHYFAEVLSGSGSESKRDGLSTFILHMMGNGLNHLSYDPIQCNPSPLSSSSDSISELLAEYSAQNSSSLHVFPYYVGLPVYCYLYKEGIHKTKFFTHDGLHLEFDRTANVVLPSYASLLNSINTIYEAIDWGTFNNIIIRGTLTPYFKISNILPFGNIFDDLFPYIGFDNINTISYVDFSNLIITSSENYSASEHKNVSSIWNSSSKNSNGIVNMSSLLAYKNYLKQTTTPFRYDHEMFKQCINLNTKRSDVDKIYTDFMGDPNDTLSFNPIYVVKYEYEKENGKVVTKVVDNFRNAVVSHLTGKHTVIHYNSSLGLSSKIVEDQIKQIQEEYQRLHFCQGVLIIPTDSNGMINSQGYILRNKLLTSMILRNSNEKIFQVSSETFSNDMGNYVRINKFYNSIQTINNTVLNFDIHDINLFNSELPALIKRFSTNFGSIKSLMNKNQKRILQFY